MRRRFGMMAAVAALCVGMLTACGNKKLIDTNYTFDRAIIQLADGTVVDTKIKSWSDYDGEQIQVIAEDGTVYLTSSFRCDLIRSGPNAE